MAGIAQAVSAAEDLRDHASYQGQKLNCDVVMKGGVTSGVTYPWAVCEIAKRYRLRNIGGTSAGAIAAAAAAAAEAGREVEGAGFARLAELPKRLARTPEGLATPTLLNLFQPQRGTEPFFNVLTARLQSGRGAGSGRTKFLIAAVRTFWSPALLGALPGLVVAALAILLDTTHPAGAMGVVVTILVALAGLVLAAIGAAGLTFSAAVRRALKAIPENRFGLCSGFGRPAEGPPCSDPGLQTGPDGRCVPKPLTTWLADELDALAGKTDSSRPLTLGDLCEAGINLKMFTTNLTEGAPYTLPFQTRRFFFAPAEFAELFPQRIVDWMRAHSSEPQDQDELVSFDRLAKHFPELLPLPSCEDFPVVVATRMSLSFPFLLSAIPLWSVDWAGTRLPGRNWFSDGGITSNFPIHFFDAPLPRWPTFGINLVPMEDFERDVDQSNNIYAPRSNAEGFRPRWRNITSAGTFAHAVADTMQNWQDNGLTRVPGYRDRIVLIKHTRTEGGINLNMPPERIFELSERGRQAGQLLVNRFAGEQSANQGDRLSWDNHRWIRFRSFTALLDTTFERLLRGYGYKGASSDRDYPSLIERPPSYRWCSNEQRTVSKELTANLARFAHSWANLPPGAYPDDPPCQCEEAATEGAFDRSRPFHCGAPRPRQALRVTPDF